MDTWVRLDTGEKITQDMLPYIVDQIPYEMDRYFVHPELRAMITEAMNQEGDKEKPKRKAAAGGGSASGKSEGGRSQPYWFATLSLDMETKDILPKEGVAWLQMRLMAKHVLGGKFDQTIEVRDEDGNLVMLAHEVGMALKFDRNTAPKSSL